ncbi:hypothetical protein FOT61_11400 [Serratia marcescens]|uniref:hypothetical protein n=1 Tax=Serratia marcescens TaxID=615 RepID=UPI0011C88C68|nr:hypothetical protein [Serratia marcescens]TXE41392.1 hypothetical protein FOT61_11400 [Serratia marcescens]
MTEVLTYEALKEKCDRLEKINDQTLQVKLTMAETIKELTDRVNALAVENQALKAAMHPEFIPDEVLIVFGDTAKYGYDSCDAGGWAWVENDDEVIKAVFGAMPKPETPATDTALADVQAQGVEKAAAALDALSAQSASATTQGNFRAAAVYLRTTVLPAIGEAK